MLVEMRATRQSLKQALVKTTDTKYFLPEDCLNSILTEATITECIDQADIDRVRRRSCKEAVLHGGKKVLALLIMLERVDLILNFVETDQASRTAHLDSRLPLEQETLRRMLADDDIAIIDIQRYQWEVLAPYFREDRVHRVFRQEIIMPFVHSKWIGSGGFGDVFEVTLPGTHHGFDFQQGCPVGYSNCYQEHD